MEKSIALFGTSADPPTIGHEKILEELSKIYAHTICYVSNNPKKKHKEDIAIRSQLLKTLFLYLGVFLSIKLIILLLIDILNRNLNNCIILINIQKGQYSKKLIK